MKYINKRLTVEKVNFQRIAKKFGTEESPDFINGILDKIFKDSKVAP